MTGFNTSDSQDLQGSSILRAGGIDDYGAFWGGGNILLGCRAIFMPGQDSLKVPSFQTSSRVGSNFAGGSARQIVNSQAEARPSRGIGISRAEARLSPWY